MSSDIPVSVQSNPPRFPVETWESIFLNLARPADLYNVALTSRYICDIVRPILYQRVYLDPNQYSIYTLSLLKRDIGLARRIAELTLLPPVSRHIPVDVDVEAEGLYKALEICRTPSTLSLILPFPQSWSPLSMQATAQSSEVNADVSRPIFQLFPTFTSLTTLHIVRDCIPSDFLHRVLELPQLITLDIQDSLVSATLARRCSSTPLPLRELCILRCWTKADISENYVAGILCDGLLENSPSLTSLTIDLFVERAACNVLAELENPPPIKIFTCHGMSHQDPDCVLLCHVLSALPSITTLSMTRMPRELGPILPLASLPHLGSLSGQIKSVAGFIYADRPLKYLTITDAPAPSGGTPWETQLIRFLESLYRYEIDLKGLAFNVLGWSEELFLCVCQLWPGLKELKIQCTQGPGVDEYFRISFGPRFLPQLKCLELLHIYERVSTQNFTSRRISKGVPVVTYHPLVLGPDEAEELAEAPVHYRRWEKLCPSLREIAFDRETWWRRLESERGGWVLRRDIIPALAQESN